MEDGLKGEPTQEEESIQEILQGPRALGQGQMNLVGGGYHQVEDILWGRQNLKNVVTNWMW